MKFRVIQSYNGNYVIQYKIWFLWKTIRRAWIHDNFAPDFIDESFKDFNDAVSFCRNLDKIKLKTYLDKQNQLFKQGWKDHSERVKNTPIINTKLSFEFTSKDNQ